ncbi:dimethylaniline monooxygenase [Aspergillus heteromorphus CBS 117.55]|uniref:Dimethylaniline monooxygenase n=1 Tax=Aspergillus heteromorphus CBS 117.55 TaxID=1448321 RepID=A0A317VPN2_9EURO|nr:dimethylaniline monooxygenase [Aspergillus heteromorphus CBS 117.55]PWY75017.1 dimethylaniline monooxygenase [Aspergillus heteromorphus CBS 117.55]
MDSVGQTNPPNPVFEKYGLSGHLRLGSNTPGPHPSSTTRPVHHPEWDEPSDRGYIVPDNLINEPPSNKPFRIIMMGAGAAGIDFLHYAPSALAGLGVDIVCYEKNADIGGTWYENRYPGCACDVPSVAYTFSWRANPHWSSFYSGAKEIWEYLKQIAVDEGMMEYIQLRTRVVSATWDECKSKWVVKLRRDGPDVAEWEDECDVFLNGSGFLNAWKWPDTPGLHSFQGDLFHTAAYPEGFSLKDKRVAVIGSGSSGVQVVAAIHDAVSHLYTWVRSPVWITTAFAKRFAGKDGQNFDYTPKQKEDFDLDREKYHRYKKSVEHDLNQQFKLALRDTAESDEALASSYKGMCTDLASKPYVRDAIIPKTFNVACRRPTPGNGYLEALASNKTTVFTERIQSITPTGVIDSATGIEQPVDVIICATGFDTSFRPRFPIIGLNGVDLAEKWATSPTSYLAIGVDGFPNYFTYSGPFAPVGHGSILPIISHLTNYFIQVVKRMRREHIRRLSPKASIVRDFVEHAQTYLRRTCWVDPCSSWFKQGSADGPVIIWPGSRMAYFEALRTPTLSDYEIEYWSGNRFGYLGSGFVDAEFSGDSITWYLDRYSDNRAWAEKEPWFDTEGDEFAYVSEQASGQKI